MVAITSSSSASSVPVLISGAGPVGLFEAYLLTKQGIQVRVIERERAICPLSKANAVHARTLEIFQFTGLIDEFLRRGFPMTDIKMLIGGQHKATIQALAGADTHYGFALFLEQLRTSEILLEELVKLGVQVDFGWELLDTQVVEAGEDGQEESYVETIIRRTLSGDDTSAFEKAFVGRVDPMEEQEGKTYETQTVRSQYLVAADGGRSTVRHKLNINFPGRTIPQRFFMWDGTFESDCDLSGVSFISGTNHTTMQVLPLTNGDARVLVEEIDSDETEDIATTLSNLTAEKFEEMASACIAPSTFKIKTTAWLTCFRVNERRADNFTYKNRIFLMGDAAHVHSPAGGQGLNTGLHDAHNLAWKLALVLNKVASESLLATYEEERQAMADRAIELSSKTLQQDRDNGVVGQIKKRLLYTFAPYLMMVMKALHVEPEAAMLDVRYSENFINQRHATQLPPRSEHQVGVRAKDGPLCTLGFTSNSNEPSQLRVHDLMLGISRFHILVFVSDTLKFTTHAGVPNQETCTVSFKELALNINDHLAQWRRKWAYSSNLNDGYQDKDLFKVHIITSTLVPGSPNNLDVMFKKNVGEGRLYLDHTKAVHEKYGFAWQGGSGGLVVVRPDSYLGYRVNGTHTQAWEDVDQYLSSVLLNV
ncbi:hypothetical protein EC968_003653 [Mortierella alpina]|nr:hypothetical protein EC968_003653 [Mortierella alpina]